MITNKQPSEAMSPKVAIHKAIHDFFLTCDSKSEEADVADLPPETADEIINAVVEGLCVRMNVKMSSVSELDDGRSIRVSFHDDGGPALTIEVRGTTRSEAAFTLAEASGYYVFGDF